MFVGESTEIPITVNKVLGSVSKNHSLTLTENEQISQYTGLLFQVNIMQILKIHSMLIIKLIMVILKLMLMFSYKTYKKFTLCF